MNSLVPPGRVRHLLEIAVARRLIDTLRRVRDAARPFAGGPPRGLPQKPVGPPTPRDHERNILGAVEAEDLAAALAAAEAGLAEFPRSSDLAFLRFNLLMHLEELDLADAELAAIVAGDPLNAPGAEICRELLVADQQRRAVLAGRALPELTAPLPSWAEGSLAALAALGAQDVATAEARIQAARAETPELWGNIDDVPFHELRDVDDPLGPILELLQPGRYLWVPLHQLAWVEVLPLRTFLDFIWTPVHVETRDGEEMRAHVPGLYAGTARRVEDRLRLGRDTTWERLGPGLSRAFGQRRYQTEDRMIALRDVHMLNFDLGG